MNPCVNEGCSEELWSLIQLESELVRAKAFLSVFGSLPEYHRMATVAYWAGYVFTFRAWKPVNDILRVMLMWPHRSGFWPCWSMKKTGGPDACRRSMS